MDNLIPVIAVQALGLVATVATISAISRSHEKRLDKLEKHIEDLPKNYVPRSEVQLMLSGISKTTEDTKALIQALVYGGGDREVAKKALEPK